MEVSRRAVIGAAGAVGAAGVLLPHLPGHHAGAQAMAGAPFPTDDPHLRGGHAPVWDELTVEDLPVRGEIPRELAGVYMRNGPNPAFPPISYTWPFDGDGMVHALHLAEGRASYRNRFVLTAGLRAERRAGRALYGGLARPVPPWSARTAIRARSRTWPTPTWSATPAARWPCGRPGCPTS